MMAAIRGRGSAIPRGRQLAPLPLDEETRGELLRLSQSTTLPHSVVLRAKMILASAEGITNTEVGRRVGASPQAVGKWRRRFLERGLDGLYDEPRPGRPRSYDDERVAGLIHRALNDKPEGGTHWTTRSLAKAEGLSQSTVSRWLRLFGVQPHLTKTSQLSADSLFVEKVHDIAGLYMNPPDHTMVLCVDGKTQVQALDRTQPALPLGPVYVEGHTHDCIRHGTATLCAALDVATGKVIAQGSQRHQGFLAFLRLLDREVPAALDVHLVADNFATHRHAKVKAWLGARPRFHLHCTPTYSSWLHQVEHWCGLISEQAVQRGCCQSEGSLIHRIHAFQREYNQHSIPFAWVATARSIRSKIERLHTRISDSKH
jgi:transposase